MRKLWLTFTAMLLCSIASFAQTRDAENRIIINSPEEFLKIGTTGYSISDSYILTENINLGTYHADNNDFVIASFSGTFDGGDYTITYQGSFTAGANAKIGLFGTNSGTITNLNLDANITVGGGGARAVMGLLCGQSSGTIQFCDVTGNINSTVNTSETGNTSTGLIVGSNLRNLLYCTGHGNVTGSGYVGGLVGSMGTPVSQSNNGVIKGCYFTGNVTANMSESDLGELASAIDVEVNSCAGGICGISLKPSVIEFCVAEAIVVTGQTAGGITTSGRLWALFWILQSVETDNNYCTGTVNGSDVTSGNIVPNIVTWSSTVPQGDNYFGNSNIENTVDALNAARCPNENNCDDNFYFDVINGKVVLIVGQQPTGEETPTYAYYRTIKQFGGFNESSTWEASVDGNDPWVENVVPERGTTANIIINKGHRVTVTHDLVITDSYKITENKGVLQITQQGQLINTTETNVPGIIEIVSSQKATQEWTFIGAPFQTGYKLETIVPVPGNDADGISDISVKKYDYATANWSDSWAHVDTEMEAGEGYFGYPFYGGVVTFTTYGDVCTWDNTNERYVIRSYNYNRTPLTVTSLNNDVVTVEETITAQSNNGYWMALSNPYPAKLSVSEFLADNGSKLQGNCVYVFRNGTFDNGSISTGEIAMTEGFFVNFKANAEKKAVFKKTQLTDYPSSTPTTPTQSIELTLINGDNEVRAYLAHNENAEQGYDIFDANKMFAPTEIAEPYFVTDGIELMKEEFAELPYYATMNVRSFADDTVSFVVNNIPEGLAVSIIDGEDVIDMVEGGVYTTEILTGENADRFKVLIKKSVSISDVEELEVNITNNNRHISIETTETDLQVEVYNALGQKVLSTKDRNFTLNQVSAGAYLIKAFNNKASKTQKIVVE